MTTDVILALVKEIGDSNEQSRFRWVVVGQNSYKMALPGLVLTVTKDPASDAVSVIAKSGGSLLGSFDLKGSDSNYKQASTLYDKAEESAKERLLSLIRQKNEPRPILGMGFPIKAASNTELKRPSDEQAISVYNKIGGTWELNYSRGIERVHIDKNGNYFIIGGDTSEKLKFHLGVSSCDDLLENVEIAKIELNGKTRQIEALKILLGQMTGYAKHDQHGLRYIRKG